MVFEKIQDIIAEQLGADKDDISMETNLTKDLEADSLDAVEIIMAIEDEFGVEIPEDQTEDFKLVGNLVQFVEDHM